MDFVELTDEEFIDFASKCPSENYLQCGPMLKRYRKENSEIYVVGVKQNEKIVAASILLAHTNRLKIKLVKACYGPILDFDSKDAQKVLQVFLEGLKTFLKSKKTAAVFLSPYVESEPRDIDGEITEGKNHLEFKKVLEKNGFEYIGEFDQKKWMFVLETKNADPNKIYNDFKGNHRRFIDQAKDKYQLKIYDLKYNQLPLFKEIVDKTSTRQNFHAPNLKYYQTIYEAFGEKVKFVAAELDPTIPSVREKLESLNVKIPTQKTIVAVAMFFMIGSEIYYMFSGSEKEFQKLGGAYLIQWHIIQYAIKHNLARYNFLGIQAANRNDGVYVFKRGFRGHVFELLGSFLLPLTLTGKIITHQKKYHKYIA